MRGCSRSRCSGCPSLGAAWLYVSTHDLGHTWRQFQRGRPLTWPPSTRERRGVRRLGTVVPRLLGYVAVVLALTATAVVVARAVHRRRRARAVTRWELRLGRDDLANPYRVQEAFEGITGAIAARWYERLWRGCDHFALEIHRLPDLSIRFTDRRPTLPRAGDQRPARGPLPRRRADRDRRRPHVGADGRARSRSASRSCSRSRPTATTSTPSPNRSSRCCPRTITRPPSSSSSPRHPAFVHRRARRLLKRRERALQHADHRDAARARHRLGRRGQGAQGRARAPAPLAAVLRPARRRHRPDHGPSRRRSVLAAALRERARPAADARPAPALRAPDRAGAAEPATGAAYAACSRPRSWRRCGSSRAPASSTPGCRARPSAARSPRRRSTATRSACCCATSAARSRSPPPIASTGTR